MILAWVRVVLAVLAWLLLVPLFEVLRALAARFGRDRPLPDRPGEVAADASASRAVVVVRGHDRRHAA